MKKSAFKQQQQQQHLEVNFCITYLVAHSYAQVLEKNGPKYNSFLFLFFKWDISGLFCRLFLSFKTNITFFQQNTYVKFLISVWCQDLNPQPLVRESPPITTTPGLLPVTKNNSFYPNWKSKKGLR